MEDGLVREERWVPISESGARWAPRSEAEARRVMEEMPPGGTYLDGEPWDGVVRVVKEVRQVTPWVEVES